MRSILFDPVWAMVQKSYGIPNSKELTVFPQKEIGPFAARERLQLIDRGDDWELIHKRLLLPSKSYSMPKSTTDLGVEPGLIVNKIIVDSEGQSETLLFTRRFNDHLSKLAQLLGMTIATSDEGPSVTDLAMES